MLEVRKYDLADFRIFESEKDDFCLWVPDRRCVVLGAVDKPETALHEDAVLADGIDVYKRPSGGHAVYLSPETLVVSAIRKNMAIHPRDFFHAINTLIIEGLQEAGLLNLSMRGISDIAVDDKKILGSSIYRKKDRIFYHAVLNISEDPEIFEKYLKHPVKEPDYRKGRSHADFVTSLKLAGNHLNIGDLTQILTDRFQLKF